MLGHIFSRKFDNSSDSKYYLSVTSPLLKKFSKDITKDQDQAGKSLFGIEGLTLRFK